jgi:hypothetical protein
MSQTKIETKKCSNCNETKATTEYYKSGMKHRDGLRGQCKKCCSEKAKVARKDKRQDPKYVEEYNRKERERYHKDKSFQKASSAKWYQKNKDVINQKHKEYRENNKDKEKDRHARYFQESKEKIYEYRKNFYNNNPGKKLMLNARRRLASSFKKGGGTERLTSCTHEFLRRWFEFHFSIDTELNFDNHGTIWHIDHVMPCAIFDTTQEEDLRKCMHWSNLMPLQIEKNLSKNNKICQVSIEEQNRRLKVFCEQENIQIIELSIPESVRDTSIAGTSLEPVDTTLESENSQDTRGNDLGHSNNSQDWTIRSENLTLNMNDLSITDESETIQV